MGEITIIYDNRTARDGLYPGWGFSALVELDGTRLLFDTGGDKIVLEHNADALGIDLKGTDYLFLSHEHCDHIGAISSALHKGLTVVYPDSFSAGFKKRIADEKLTGIPVEEPIEFSPGFRSTGELGDEIKEQSLIVAGKDGPVLITGCAHPGIIRIARVATELSGRPPSLVIGGYHLGSKTDSEVEGIAEFLKRLGVKRVAPCHCTGERAMNLLRGSLGFEYIDVKAGASLEI
ncbi:MBL fold metallo-hydrolase [Candidatus Acetothermia bacterium]|nr:MAG: MBL fold metallo-hydrolase [Candidatus Acetothermia bacterium]